MVFDPTTHRMLDASKPSAGRGRKKRGFRRRSSSSGASLGAKASDDEAAAEAAGEVAASDPPPPRRESAAPAHVYSDERVKRAAKNARLRALCMPVAIAVGLGALGAGMAFGLESFIAAIVASVLATLTYKLIDAQVR